jgi:hypothetical protein
MNNKTQKRSFGRPIMGVMALLAVFCLSFTARSVYAAFEDSGWGVRPLGMGGAFAAIADDANGQLYNPAGLATVQQKEFSLMSAMLYTGLDTVNIGQNYLGYVHPLNEKFGTLGIAWGAISSPNLYREDTAAIGYGRTMNDIVKIRNLDISLGVNVKYLKHEYTLDIRTVNDPVFAHGNSAAATTGDAGILVEWVNTGLNFALASRNITSPDVGLNSPDIVYTENVFAVSHYAPTLPYLRLPHFTSALDIVSRNTNTDLRLGAESRFYNGAFAIRAGGSQEDVTFGLGYEISLSGNSKIIVDYSFAWPLQIQDTTGSHRIGLTIRFP